MKRLFTLVAVVSLAFNVMAQEVQAPQQTLEFYYIAHDKQTPVGKVCDFLIERQKEATYYKDLAMVFYLANGDNPMIVRMNLQGDNRKEFQNIINALQQQISHDISPKADREEIVRLFNELDFVDDEGNPNFKSFQWISFVTPMFWQMKYNEDVLAALYFILDMGQLPEGYLTMDVYYDNATPLNHNKKYPFGEKNMCGPCNILPLL